MRKNSLIRIIVFCFVSTVSHAMPRLSREGDGVIQSVNWNTKTFTIRMEEQSQLKLFEWDRDTQFFEGFAASTARGLSPAGAVHIRYHVPFFGKPYVCKVLFVGRPKSLHRHRRYSTSAAHSA